MTIKTSDDGYLHAHEHFHSYGSDDHNHAHGTPNSWAGGADYNPVYWAMASAAVMSILSFSGAVVLAVTKLDSKLSGFLEYTCLTFSGAVMCSDALIHLLPHCLMGAGHDESAMLGVEKK